MKMMKIVSKRICLQAKLLEGALDISFLSFRDIFSHIPGLFHVLRTAIGQSYTSTDAESCAKRESTIFFSTCQQTLIPPYKRRGKQTTVARAKMRKIFLTEL